MSSVELDLTPSLSPSPATSESDGEPERAPLDYIEHIFDRELKLTLLGVELGSERDDSLRELTETAASLYDGRIIRELIQNAYDGSGETKNVSILVRLDLSMGDHGILDVANSGYGFTKDDVDSIVNPARSRKRPGNSIGHKGLGFRSVTLISETPQVYSSRTRSGDFDGYSFRFATVADQLSRLLELGSKEHAQRAAGKAHRFQLPVPIRTVPDDVRSYSSDYATLIRLPLVDDIAAANMDREWQDLFDERSPIALFLPRLAKLTIERIDANGKCTQRVLDRRPRAPKNLLQFEGLDLQEIESEGRRFLIASRRMDRERFLAAVRRAIAQRHKVEKWLEWQGDPTVSVALPLGGEGQLGRYYAFLPMEKATPFNGSIDAPFFPDPDRRGLSLTNALNDELVDVAAEICLALLTGVAGANTTGGAEVHAAVDAIAWTDTARIFRAMRKVGLKNEELPLPVVSRVDTEARWSTLDRVFDWDDQKHRSLRAVWMAKVTGEDLLRRNMGTRRVEVLRQIGDAAGLPLEPGPGRLAGWMPQLAADLARRRSATAKDWEDFYSELSDRRDVLDLLKGAVIFRNEAQRLVAAEGGKQADGRPTQLFINVEAGRGGRSRRRRRLDDTSQFPPSGITKGMEFADPTLAWPTDVVGRFVRAGLASEFKLVQVIGRIGGLLGTRPKKKDAVAVMQWAFRSWRDHRSEEFDRAVRLAGIMVPVADGSMVPASGASFSAGWRDTQGDLLDEFLREGTGIRELDAFRKRLLPDWSEWPVNLGDGAQEWRDFLRLAGVRDGLLWYRTREVSLPWYEWNALRNGGLEQKEFERTLGPTWRQSAAKERTRPTFVSGSYKSAGLPYVLGQHRYSEFSGPAKWAYGRLLATLISLLPDDAWTFSFSRIGTRSERITWSSPLAAFLKSANWLPVASYDDFVGLRPDQSWFGSKGEVPRFVPKVDRSVRELIDGNAKLKDALINRLGMPSWSDPNTAPNRLRALGELLQAGMPDAFMDDFRKAMREAWAHYADLSPRPSLPSPLVLAIDSRTGLSPLELSKNVSDVPTIFVDDGRLPIFQQVLSALGHTTIEVHTGAGDRCAEALRQDLGADAQPIHEGVLLIEADGAEFSPEPSDQPLVTGGREWIADVAVLVLEVSTRLSSQNTLSTRQALSDAVRRVRIRLVERITVSVDGNPSPLPSELDGVLPIPDQNSPTILVEARDLNWDTLARIAAAVPSAIGRTSLADSLGLIFSALRTEMSSDIEPLVAPSDQQLAKVLRRPVSRISELLRSLRATTLRLLEFVLPIVHALGHAEAAAYLDEKADRLTEDAEVVAALARRGVSQSEGARIVSVCRDAGTLNEARRALGIALPVLNASLVALGRAPIGFKDRLLYRFSTRLEQRRTELERLVRDAKRRPRLTGTDLSDYVETASLRWLTMPDAWVAEHDDVDDEIIDAELDRRMTEALGSGPFPTGDAPEPLRQHNRQVLAGMIESLRNLVRAWCRKNSVSGPTAWEESQETVGRAAVVSGSFDFDRLTEDGIAEALSRAGLWPNGMPLSRTLEELGLHADDLDQEEREERRRQDRQLRERRSLNFGSTQIEGGIDGWLDAVANAMEGALKEKGFKERSGPANLLAFGPSGRSRPGSRSPGTRGEDPQYLSQEQRDLIGFAGELAAYRYLQIKHRSMRGEHWVSSTGRRYLGLPAMDDQGFDFKVSDARGFVHYEVKAHSGDPGYVDLERSQVAAAASMRSEGSNRWRILYVSNARSSSVAVHELPNPYSDESSKLFRDSHTQGVRLSVRRG